MDLVQLPEDPRLHSELGRAQYERDRLEWEEEKQKNKVGLKHTRSRVVVLCGAECGPLLHSSCLLYSSSRKHMERLLNRVKVRPPRPYSYPCLHAACYPRTLLLLRVRALHFLRAVFGRVFAAG